MTDTPTPLTTHPRYVQLTPPHSYVAQKPEELDRDRFITLTLKAAEVFSTEMNLKFATPRATSLLSSNAASLAQIITDEPHFPFRATLTEGVIRLTPALDKNLEPPILKEVSDGVTAIYAHYVRQHSPSEQAKVDFSLLFQRAIQQAYEAAGMSESAHTKYTERGC